MARWLNYQDYRELASHYVNGKNDHVSNIKSVRERTGCGLAEAKSVCDAIRESVLYTKAVMQDEVHFNGGRANKIMAETFITIAKIAGNNGVKGLMAEGFTEVEAHAIKHVLALAGHC